MKEEKKWIGHFSKPVLVLGVFATIVWVMVLYHTFAMAEADRFRALGTAQLNWLEQSVDRHGRVLDGLAGWIVAHDGNTEGFEAQASRYMGFSHCVQSVQLFPLHGEQKVTPWAGWALDVEDELPLWVKDFTEHKRLTPMLVQENEKTGGEDLILLRPVYLDKGERNAAELWGFVALTTSAQGLYDEMNLARFQKLGVDHELSWLDTDGKKQILISRGDFSGVDVEVHRKIGGALWTLRLQPEDGWCSWWVILLGIWSGVMPTMMISFYRRRSITAETKGNHDFLTGAFNRSGGEKAAEQYLKAHRHEKVRVMALDIDNFKLVNDMYGHEAGDEVLKRLVVDAHLAFPGAVVIRNGGDEFMIIQSYEEEGLMNEHIRLFVKTPHRVMTKSGEIQFTTSMGCATYPEQDSSYLKLANKADFALYNAKLNGKSDWRPFDASLLTLQKRVRLGFNLSDFSNHMPGAMFVNHCDDDAKILFASDPAVSLLSCDSWEDFQDYSKGSFKNVVHPDDWQRIYVGARKLEAEGEGAKQIKFFPVRLLTKNGEIKEVFSVGQYHVNPFHGGVFYVTVFDKSRIVMSDGK